MNAPTIRSTKKGPEAVIQQKIVDFLMCRGWHVMVSHGNMYMMGWPDLYVTHSRWRSRWVEVKNIESFSFTAAQLDNFPKMAANGSGIWVLSAATEDEYRKLWAPPNWHIYLMLTGQRTANHLQVPGRTSGLTGDRL